ncbi:MAG: YdcF family protein [Burkholderiaceae bacterium]|nr:YdcF family protein [Burkholderiaceae bacterium]
MNDWLLAAGLPWLKLALKQLLLPPASPLLLAALGLLLLRRWPRLGRWIAGSALALLWLLCLPAVGLGLGQWLCTPPPPLDAARLQALRGAPHTAVLVLGAGRRDPAPEYGMPDLPSATLERLRYGAFVARQTGLPLGFSGGLAPFAEPGATEAAAAALVAQRDFGMRLRWREDRSQDTADNARRSLALLHADGITRIVLVTHDLHQRRALAAFRRAAEHSGINLSLVPAPIEVPPPGPLTAGDWWPSVQGLRRSWYAIYEALGRLAGA